MSRCQVTLSRMLRRFEIFQSPTSMHHRLGLQAHPKASSMYSVLYSQKSNIPSCPAVQRNQIYTTKLSLAGLSCTMFRITRYQIEHRHPPHKQAAAPHATASRTSNACSHTHAVYPSYDSCKKRQRSYIDTKNKFKSRTLLGISIYLKRVYLLSLFFSNTALIWSIAFCLSLLGCRTALIL